MKRVLILGMMLAGTLVYADAVLAWGPGGGGSGAGGSGAGAAGAGAAGAAGAGAAGAAGVGDASGPGGESGPGDGLGGSPAGYSRDRFRYESPAGRLPGDAYPQASPRSGASTAPVVVSPPPADAAIVPTTPLICPNVNPGDPRKC